MKYFSDTYKREVQGDELCGFWRHDNGGICKGWPGKDEHPCPANKDGSGCPIFPRVGRKDDE